MTIVQRLAALVCSCQLARVSSEDYINGGQLASKPTGTYCGTVVGASDVHLKLAVLSHRTVNITAEVDGLTLVCENEPYEIVNGEFRILRQMHNQSCVRQQLEKFDHNPEHVHVVFDAKTDDLSIAAPSAQPVHLTHRSCTASATSRRLMGQPFGEYCGTVEGVVDVDVRFNIKDEFHADVTAHVYGLTLVCDNEQFELYKGALRSLLLPRQIAWASNFRTLARTQPKLMSNTMQKLISLH